MNTRILLLVLSVAALSSCSSVYKSGQTPDDVYFSPARPQADSYVEVRQEKPGSNYQTYEQYQDSYRDDRFLRMSVGNPYYLDAYNSYSGFDWRYNSFYNGFNYGFNSPWNNYFAWNNFYNPYSMPYLSFGSGFYGGYGYNNYGYNNYGYGGGYYNGGGVKYTAHAAPLNRPAVFDVRGYSNNGSNNRSASGNYNNSNGNFQRYNNTNTSSGNRSYYNNSNSGSGNRTYTPSNNNYNSGNNNTYTPSRSYTPSSSGGSSSGGGGGGSSSGGVSRPTRGN